MPFLSPRINNFKYGLNETFLERELFKLFKILLFFLIISILLTVPTL